MIRALAIALTLLHAETAGAMVKLCLPSPSVSHVIAVPAHPSLVVSRSAIDAEGDDLIRTFTGFKNGARVPDQPLRYTVQDIDENNARVVVDATNGVQFFAASVVGGECRGVTYKVAPPREAPDDRGFLFTEAKTYLLGDDARQWTLKRTAQDHRAWTRIEWAYDIATVESGRGNGAWSDQSDKLYVDTPPEKIALFVKVTVYNADGTISLARSKVSRRGETVTIEGVPDKP